MQGKICTGNSMNMASGSAEEVFTSIIGNNQIFRRQIETARRTAANDLPVFITGETGTGKDIVARAIHRAGPRRRAPYIAENCGAVPESLAEGIFFGTERGAFTEAITRPGLFEEADGGTIFLDELNSMPVYLQAKLLRALQENSLRRIGGTRDIAFDVRVVSAVNEPPELLMKTGRLRSDLYYRLAAVRIDLPPLRQRRDDIPLFIEHFLTAANRKYEKKVVGFDSKSMDLLMKMDYPGNVRQLQNIVESAVAMSLAEEILSLDTSY